MNGHITQLVKPIFNIGRYAFHHSNRNRSQFTVHTNKRWYHVTINLIKRDRIWHGHATIFQINGPLPREPIALHRSSRSLTRARFAIEFSARSAVFTAAHESTPLKPASPKSANNV